MSKKIITINQNRIFKKLYRTGKTTVDSTLVTYIKKNNLGYCRIGITVSTKIGNAVKRNRAKRVIRESFRLILKENPSLMSKGFDFVYVGRAKTTKVKLNKVKDIMYKHLHKEGLI